VSFVRLVRCVKFSCAACWDARGGHASPHIPPDDAALSGLPETVVEPGDGGCDTDDRDDAHAGRKESTPAGRSLR
jgi:hypothetical protein